MKQTKAPYLFDAKHGIALHEMQGNWASFCSEGDVSWFFLSCDRNLGYILELGLELTLKTRFCSAMSGLLSSYKGHLRNLLEAWQGKSDTSTNVAGYRG